MHDVTLVIAECVCGIWSLTCKTSLWYTGTRLNNSLSGATTRVPNTIQCIQKSTGSTDYSIIDMIRSKPLVNLILYYTSDTTQLSFGFIV